MQVAEKSLEQSLSLSLIDRSVQERTPYMSMFVPALKLEPHAEGYTVMLESERCNNTPDTPTTHQTYS